MGFSYIQRAESWVGPGSCPYQLPALDKWFYLLVNHSHLRDEVLITLTTLLAVKVQRCWIQVRGLHRARSYQVLDKWPLSLERR